MKIGLVLEGGFMKGAYVGGAVRALADLGLTQPDVICAVSISTFTASYFVSGQYSEIVHVWKNIVAQSRFMGWRTRLRRRCFYDLNRLVFEVFAKEVPFKKQVAKESPIKLFFAVTNYETGQIEYLDNHSKGDIFYKMLAATANHRVYPSRYYSGGKIYRDGGFSCPLPLQKAVEEGCDRIILIRTQDGYQQKWRLMFKLAKRFLPVLARHYRQRQENFNSTKKLVEELKARGQILVLSPKEISPHIKFTRKAKDIRAWVDMGYRECLEMFACHPNFLPIKDPKEFLALTK